MSTPLRLLIVEDSVDDAWLLIRELTKQGFDLQYERLETPEAMHEALATKKWDVVISDYVMPRFSGLEALGILKESGFDIPFIIVSGKIGEETAVETMKNGAHDYILKGNLARLAPAIKREMEEAETRGKRKQAEEERYKIEQQFQHAQKLESLGILAGGIAHDFNNILTIIMGHCYMARADMIEMPSLETHFQQIELAVNRAADLCRQMLTYAGKCQLMMTQVDMYLLIDETVKMLQAGLKKNVTIELDLKNDVPLAIGDKTQIQQIIMNLVINAAEAIDDRNGTIKIVLAKKVVAPDQVELDCIGAAIPPGPYIFLEISDNGCGMDEVTKMRLFEPFYTTKFTGRGLGMSAILGIIKSHIGAIQLSSVSGTGTTFGVYLPLPETAVKDTEPAANQDLSQPMSGTILLVDDEAAILEIGSVLLNKMGFSVITAFNGCEALKKYRDAGDRIVLVLLDLAMPQMGGVEAYHELRKIDARLPVVICSGYSIEEVYESIKSDLYAGFLHKPYKLEDLQDVLQRLLTCRDELIK